MSALTLILPTAGTRYRLIDLIRSTAGYGNTSLLCNFLTLRAADSNGLATRIYMGGADVSLLNYAVRLAPGDSRSYEPTGPGAATVDLNRYILGSDDALALNVDWQTA